MMFSEDDLNSNLQEADFPDYFIDKHHPDDYKIVHEPISELIYHRKLNHNRLILRISFQLSRTMFLPVTFVCDTGAPMFIYLNKITRRLIKDRIIINDGENEFIIIGEKKFTINCSPDVNIIGLRALSMFGLVLDFENFGFNRLPNYF